MRDLIVTTPKREMANAAAEAEWAKQQGGGPSIHYFRRIPTVPRDAGPGSKVYYVENGYIRGYAVLLGIDDGSGIGNTCEVTGRDWSGNWQLVMRADSWKWIKPIPMRGFQGWRYFDGSDCEEVGGWLDPRPSDPS